MALQGTIIQQRVLSLRIALPILAGYFALTLIGILNHEIWLDEAQHFLIARDSRSIGELFTNMKYDGHVQLWNYILFFITHYLSGDIIAMQFFHLVAINAAAFVFLRYAPFGLLVKVLVLTGYYFLFEYSLISRNYALGILFLFIACNNIGKANKRYVVGLMCGLMCLTHLFFLFAATGILLYHFYDSLVSKRVTSTFIVVGCCYILGLALAFAQMRQIPPDNTYFHPEHVQLSDVKNPSYSIYGIARGFLPMQDVSNPHPWGTFAFDRMNRFVKVFVSLALLVYPFFLLRGSRRGLLFFYSSCSLLLVFFFMSQMLASRYYGIFFIYLLCALWLPGNEETIPSTMGIRRPELLVPVFYCMLAVQVCAGLYAYVLDVSRPFSLAKNVVTYLDGNDWSARPIAIDGYGGVPPISAQLGKKVYCLDIGRPSSYCIWKQSYFPLPRRTIEDEFTTSAYPQNINSFVLVSTRLLPEHIAANESTYRLTELKRFTGGIIKPDYYIYSVEK